MTTTEPTPLPASFTRLNLAQVCGALNDSLVKLLLAFYLVSRAVEFGIVPLGAIGLTVSAFALHARLRKENHRLRLEREILKKAAAFFAKESGSGIEVVSIAVTKCKSS